MNKRERSFRHTTFEVNGVSYQRLEDVPEEFRHLFVDADANGIPDIVESPRDPALVSKTLEFRWSGVSTERAADPRSRLPGPDASARRPPEEPSPIRCARCGYDLTGSVIGHHCPECGFLIAHSIHSLINPQPSRFARVVDVLWHYRGTLPSVIVAVVLLLVFLAMRLVI